MKTPPGDSPEVQASALSISRLTSARTLAVSTGINLLSGFLPAAVGFAAMPFVVRGFGPERYGLFSLLWAMISFFLIFDLGLGRATTKYISEALGRKDEGAAEEIIWSSILTQLFFGGIGGLLLGAGSLVLVSGVLNIPPRHMEEARASFLALALSAPLALVEFTLSGALQAAQRFGLVAAVNAPAKCLVLLTLLLTATLGWSLLVFVFVYSGLKVVSILLYFRFCQSLYPGLHFRPRFSRTRVASMFHFGKWVTFAALANSMLANLDKYYLGSIASMALVSAYAGPFQLVDRMSIAQMSLGSVLFPCLSVLKGAASHGSFRSLFTWSLKLTCMVFGTMALVLVGFSDVLVWLFLGREYLPFSVSVLQILVMGFFFNSMAIVPLSVLQASGRPDLPGKYLLVEMPVHALSFVILFAVLGVPGLALAWAMRAMLDFLLLMHGALRGGQLGPRAFVEHKLHLIIGTYTAAVLFAVGTQSHVEHLGARMALLAGIALGACALWLSCLSGLERERAMSLTRRAFGMAGQEQGG